MMDMMMKMGMILIGIALIGMMVAFAYNALRQPPVDERFPSINGTGVQLDFALQKLCKKCLGQQTDKDCYVIDTNVSTDYAGYGLSLTTGNAYTLKMKNAGGSCNVSVW